MVVYFFQKQSEHQLCLRLIAAFFCQVSLDLGSIQQSLNTSDESSLQLWKCIGEACVHLSQTSKTENVETKIQHCLRKFADCGKITMHN